MRSNRAGEKTMWTGASKRWNIRRRNENTPLRTLLSQPGRTLPPRPDSIPNNSINIDKFTGFFDK